MQDFQKAYKIKMAIKKLEAELATVLEPIRQRALRDMATLKCDFGDGHHARLVVRHRYRPIQASQLRGLRGERRLFKEVVDTKVKDYDGLQQACQRANIDLDRYVYVTVHYQPISGAHEVASNRAMELIRQHIYAPALEVR